MSLRRLRAAALQDKYVCFHALYDAFHRTAGEQARETSVPAGTQDYEIRVHGSCQFFEGLDQFPFMDVNALPRQAVLRAKRKHPPHAAVIAARPHIIIRVGRSRLDGSR